MEPVYTPVIGLVKSVYRVMGWRVDVRGAAHIPPTGPVVIATNHVGYLDFTFVGLSALERQRLVRFMAKKEVFDHRLAGPLMRGMKHIPVDRFGRANDSIDAAVGALRRGEAVGMFPEGTISRAFVPAPGKTGAARMAMESGATLIPGAVWGSQRILTKGRARNWQRNVAISVTYGPPIDYLPDDDPAVVTKRLMEAIGELVDDAARRYPQRPAGDDDRWWLPAHLGGSAPTVEESMRLSEQERAERRARRRRERR
jgi:1-acyl-sn-glycerol-3-phosphate acyltransferase